MKTEAEPGTGRTKSRTPCFSGIFPVAIDVHTMGDQKPRRRFSLRIGLDAHDWRGPETPVRIKRSNVGSPPPARSSSTMSRLAPSRPMRHDETAPARSDGMHRDTQLPT